MSHENCFIKKHKLIELLKSPKKTTITICTEKLSISRRSFFRYIEEFRDAGANIKYSRRYDTYTLENDFCYLKFILNKTQ
jgi:predicted DNA-binding transcriptional regulator YafY